MHSTYNVRDNIQNQAIIMFSIRFLLSIELLSYTLPTCCNNMAKLRSKLPKKSFPCLEKNEYRVRTFFKAAKAFFRINASGAVIMTFSMAYQCP